MSDRDLARTVWNAVVYFGCLIYFGLSFWNATVVGFAIFVSCLVGYGNRWLIRGGVLMLVVTVLMIIGLVPQPDELKPILKELRSSIAARLH